MAGPDGALGVTFKSVRILQAICILCVIGLTSNFVSQIVNSNERAPQVLIGTLSVACIAELYCVITFILHLDRILPYLIMAIMDFLILIALIVVAVTVGEPLTYLNCRTIGTPNSASNAFQFTSELGSSLNENGSTIDYSTWIGTTMTICYEMKAIWGLSIALCVLFAFSVMCGVCLWRRKPVLVKGGEA